MTTASQSGRTTASRPHAPHPAPTAAQVANIRLLYDARGPAPRPEDRGGGQDDGCTTRTPKEIDHA
jgi:hypothetical protein